jgi:hypothetical protein
MIGCEDVPFLRSVLIGCERSGSVATQSVLIGCKNGDNVLIFTNANNVMEETLKMCKVPVTHYLSGKSSRAQVV